MNDSFIAAETFFFRTLAPVDGQPETTIDIDAAGADYDAAPETAECVR